SGVAGKLVENTGLRITKDTARDALEVTRVTKDSPAEQAGLKLGDVILQFARFFDDGGEPLSKPEIIPTKGLTLEPALAKLKGKPGSKVTVQYVRESEQPAECSITYRADIRDLQFKELEQAAYNPTARQFWEGKIGRLKGQ